MGQHAGVHRHQGDPVGHHVVHLPGDPGPLGQPGLGQPGLLGLVAGPLGLLPGPLGRRPTHHLLLPAAPQTTDQGGDRQARPEQQELEHDRRGPGGLPGGDLGHDDLDDLGHQEAGRRRHHGADPPGPVREHGLDDQGSAGGGRVHRQARPDHQGRHDRAPVAQGEHGEGHQSRDGGDQGEGPPIGTYDDRRQVVHPEEHRDRPGDHGVLPGRGGVLPGRGGALPGRGGALPGRGGRTGRERAGHGRAGRGRAGRGRGGHVPSLPGGRPGHDRPSAGTGRPIGRHRARRWAGVVLARRPSTPAVRWPTGRADPAPPPMRRPVDCDGLGP
ncbi:hypothetical protein SDC9_97534 [bioreactor metagenome]|uniref:Uncharacterized protein n=1 Tax=bioreactor metagenome TaxID=1076179 RepID=A0A645AET1_9ZZZZ